MIYTCYLYLLIITQYYNINNIIILLNSNPLLNILGQFAGEEWCVEAHILTTIEKISNIRNLIKSRQSSNTN